MANYSSDDSRVTLLFGQVPEGGGRFRYELLRFWRIRHNVDQPGRHESYLQPIPSGLLYNATAGTLTATAFPPIEELEIIPHTSPLPHSDVASF